MAVSLSHLRSFWAVLNAGGFSSAARAINVAQPTLTRQIRELEKGYGLVLFERSARGLKLSPEGEVLAPIVNAIFERVQEAENFLKQHKKFDVRLAAVTTIVTSRLISAIQSASPELRLSLSVGTSSAVLDAIVGRRCDVGILTLPEGKVSSISSVTIGTYPLLAILPEGHRLIGRKTVALADLAGEPIIAGSRASQARSYLESAAAKAGVDLQVAQEIDAYEVIGELVRLGLGVGVIGYSGIIEKNLPHVLTIEECANAIPVHFACLSINRRIRTIDHLFNVAELAVVEGKTAPFLFSGHSGSP